MKKKILLLAVLVLATIVTAFAQDKIYTHEGEVITAKITRVTPSVINYSIAKDSSEKTIGKLAIDKVVYENGREEIFSKKISVNGKKDWENVVIVTDASMLIGMRKGGVVDAKKSGWFNYNSNSGIDKKTSKMIMEQAAEYNAPYILIVANESNDFKSKVRSAKEGYAYHYDSIK